MLCRRIRDNSKGEIETDFSGWNVWFIFNLMLGLHLNVVLYLPLQVHPSDVLGPSVPGPIVLLVDCPTESHLEALLSAQSLTSYYADSMVDLPEGGKSVTCMIHLSPASTISCSNYQKWMEKFGSAQHIMAGHEE